MLFLLFTGYTGKSCGLRKKWKIKEKYGSFVIKEFFQKEGILKRGNFHKL